MSECKALGVSSRRGPQNPWRLTRTAHGPTSPSPRTRSTCCRAARRRARICALGAARDARVRPQQCEGQSGRSEGVRARLSLHGERLSDQCVIDDRIRSMRVKSSENTSAQSPSADTKTIDGCSPRVRWRRAHGARASTATEIFGLYVSLVVAWTSSRRARVTLCQE